MVKSTKKHRIWFGLLRVLLFTVFLYLLYVQLKRSKVTFEELEVRHFSLLVLLILLTPLNWWFELRKWQKILKHAGVKSSPAVQRTSFFAGMVTGMLTPNMLGNFIGRMYYFPRRERFSVTILTLIANFAQFIISFAFGTAAVMLLANSPLGPLNGVQLVVLACVLLGAFIGLLFYDVWLKAIFPRRYRLIMRIRNISEVRTFSFHLLWLSFLRHLVFTLQLICALLAFGAQWDQDLVLWIWQYYLWLTLAPSLFLGKVIVRDSVALWVLGAGGLSAAVVLPSSLLIWIVNLLLPTLVALLLIRQKKQNV